VQRKPVLSKTGFLARLVKTYRNLDPQMLSYGDLCKGRRLSPSATRTGLFSTVL
jgi:hypothetical protein